MARTTVVIYEREQLNALLRFLAAAPKEGGHAAVLAIGADIEFALEKMEIPFFSACDLRSVSSVNRIAYSEELGRAIFDHPSLSFFTHQDIKLSSLFRMSLQEYIAFLSYYVDILTSAIQQQATENMVILASTIRASSTSGVTAPLEVRLVVDAALVVCRQMGIDCHVVEEHSVFRDMREHAHDLALTAVRVLFGWVLRAGNMLQSLRSRKKVRILASEYWKNIAPFMAQLPEGELFLIDRLESRNAGIAALWRHRMRFEHIKNFTSRRMQVHAAKKADFFAKEWRRALKENMPLQNAVFRGSPLAALLASLMEHIVVIGGKRAVQDIEGTRSMLERLHPDVVLVRASASAQTHFSILCYVARSLGIPSLEVQHGVRYVGPGSFSTSHAAEYMAVYGPVVQQQMKEVGYKDETLFNVGSPRFDTYLSATTETPHQQLIIACIAPSIVPGFWDDTYDAIDYFQSMFSAIASLPDVSVSVKLRPGVKYRDFIEEVLRRSAGTTSYRVFRTESLRDVFSSSDVVVTPFSTSMLEALLMNKPTVFAAMLPAYAVYGAEFTGYAQDGALMLARTRDELANALVVLAQDPAQRDRLRAGARACLQRNYSFDGKASKRLADVVRTLAKRAQVE